MTDGMDLVLSREWFEHGVVEMKKGFDDDGKKYISCF